jgi:hypothetical protein
VRRRLTAPTPTYLPLLARSLDWRPSTCPACARDPPGHELARPTGTPRTWQGIRGAKPVEIAGAERRSTARESREVSDPAQILESAGRRRLAEMQPSHGRRNGTQRWPEQLRRR